MFSNVEHNAGHVLTSKILSERYQAASQCSKQASPRGKRKNKRVPLIDLKVAGPRRLPLHGLGTRRLLFSRGLGVHGVSSRLNLGEVARHGNRPLRASRSGRISASACRFFITVTLSDRGKCAPTVEALLFPSRL